MLAFSNSGSKSVKRLRSQAEHFQSPSRRASRTHKKTESDLGWRRKEAGRKALRGGSSSLVRRQRSRGRATEEEASLPMCGTVEQLDRRSKAWVCVGPNRCLCIGRDTEAQEGVIEGSAVTAFHAEKNELNNKDLVEQCSSTHTDVKKKSSDSRKQCWRLSSVETL